MSRAAWGPPKRIDEVDARSADDPARVDPYVEHWFWRRARDADRPREAPVADPGPRGPAGDWPRTVLRGLFLDLLARMRADARARSED